MENIGIFVDVQNIYYTVKQQYHCHFDYRHFIKKVSRGRKILFANAYATDKNDPSQKRFQTLLSSFGYTVKLINYIQRKDGSSKGDWDVGIAVDIMKRAPDLDRAILVSGDGDFASVVKEVKADYGLPFELYGVPELTSSQLIAVVDEFFPIDSEYIMGIPEKW